MLYPEVNDVLKADFCYSSCTSSSYSFFSFTLRLLSSKRLGGVRIINEFKSSLLFEPLVALLTVSGE